MYIIQNLNYLVSNADLGLMFESIYFKGSSNTLQFEIQFIYINLANQCWFYSYSFLSSLDSVSDWNKSNSDWMTYLLAKLSNQRPDSPNLHTKKGVTCWGDLHSKRNSKQNDNIANNRPMRASVSESGWHCTGALQVWKDWHWRCSLPVVPASVCNTANSCFNARAGTST